MLAAMEKIEQFKKMRFKVLTALHGPVRNNRNQKSTLLPLQ